MYLKSLKLVGFKSFADRTRLELRPGVTVVVGPNGSGKSNIVDAIAWVMGTQSTKSLRTHKMEDVVFAGTATRPPLNRAEVTLVIDNATRMLALDLDEVSITRRLYRDGSSDYELNGVTCRLLDVQELLSDSGVGRHQHVIVGQGQIDNVLNSGPLEHRAVIEEAAGILKHRQRKDRALRRLERTDADLVRLEDLVGELTRQMRPLRRQARDAAAQQRLITELRAVRLYLGGERLREIDDRVAGLEAERKRLAQATSDGEAELGELASALHILTAEAGVVGEALDRDTAAAARLETIMERMRRSASVAHERRTAALASREGAAERRQDLADERRAVAAELAEVGGEVARAEAKTEQEERRFRAVEDEARVLADQGSLTPEGALAVVRGEIRALEAAGQRDARELEQIERRLEVVAAHIEDESEDADRVNAEIRHLDDTTATHQSAYERAERERARRQEHWEAIEDDHRRILLEAAASRARLEAVVAAAQGQVDPEARRLVEGAAGHRGSLTSLLGIGEELAAAVDAALGTWADAAAFDGPDSLESVVASLKSAGQGGVPVVFVQSAGTVPARSAATTMGADALVDLLGAGADRAVAERLLGDVVMVGGWSAGWRIVSRHPALRAVTPEGDLITVNGIRVAHPEGATPAMVEAAELAVERAELEGARMESLRTSARRDFDRARQAERAALEALEAFEARLSGATEALGRLGRSRSNLDEEKGRLDARRAALVEATADRRDGLDLLRRDLAALEGEEAERQAAWEQMEERRAAVEARRELARAAWQQAAANLRAATERQALLEERIRVIDEALSADVGAAVTDSSLRRLGLVEDTARAALEAISSRLAELRHRQAELRARATDAGAQRDRVRRRHEETRSSLEGGRRRLAEIEVASTELRIRRESVAEGLRRDADADEKEALSAPVPVVTEAAPDLPLVRVLEDFEARLRRMGPVNPLAAREYAELEERHTFLQDQLADLRSSRDELRRVVSALDEEIQVRFLTAYDEVAAAYAEHFAVLFPGGTGKLTLSEPDHPLDSGIEIRAQPLGKKVSQLTLLSGGERSLAALAFLFAVFRARPSPFYVLDEVEAALDDSNLRRFMRLIEAFRDQAQLVIVTHQQQTMESANVLYGVTLEPGGSSAVVRKELVGADSYL